MPDEIDLQLREKAATGDGNAMFDIALHYRRALEELPDTESTRTKKQKLQERRTLLANEFYKMMHDATQAGSEAARDYVQELTEQNAIPLHRYDGKIFRGMADLAAAGDQKAYNIAKSISGGLGRALIQKVAELQFPGETAKFQNDIAQNIHHGTSPSFASAAKIIKKSRQVFESFSKQSSENSKLHQHYNEQSDTLSQIEQGLNLYSEMRKILHEVHPRQLNKDHYSL